MRHLTLHWRVKLFNGNRRIFYKGILRSDIIKNCPGQAFRSIFWAFAFAVQLWHTIIRNLPILAKLSLFKSPAGIKSTAISTKNLQPNKLFFRVKNHVSKKTQRHVMLQLSCFKSS